MTDSTGLRAFITRIGSSTLRAAPYQPARMASSSQWNAASDSPREA